MWGRPSDHHVGEWLYVHADQRSARMYCEGGEPPVPVLVTVDPDGIHYGWVDANPPLHQEPGVPEMIQPHRSLFEMQFPYGSRAEAERGKGWVVRLTVTERTP